MKHTWAASRNELRALATQTQLVHETRLRRIPKRDFDTLHAAAHIGNIAVSSTVYLTFLCSSSAHEQLLLTEHIDLLMVDRLIKKGNKKQYEAIKFIPFAHHNDREVVAPRPKNTLSAEQLVGSSTCDTSTTG